MNRKLQQLFSTLFLLFFLATIIVYFATGKNMKWTWITGACAVVTYFLYRFSRR